MVRLQGTFGPSQLPLSLSLFASSLFTHSDALVPRKQDRFGGFFDGEKGRILIECGWKWGVFKEDFYFTMLLKD